MQEIVINIEAGERRVAILRSKKLEWYFVERINERRIVGNIYKGIVESVLDGMGAAFINCGLEKNGFLYVSDITTPTIDIEDDDSDFVFAGNGERHIKKEQQHAKISELLKRGKEIVVQVTKEEIGTKGARLSTYVSLPGRYLVLMPSVKRIGVSHKIKNEEERHRIKSILQDMKLPADIGIVARTVAEGCDKKEFLRDINYLLDTYNRINKIAKQSKAPQLLYEEMDLSLKVIRDFLTKDTSKVIIDDKQEFNRLKHFVGRIAPDLRNRLAFYQEHIPLLERHGVETEIDKLFERKIFLKCGGYITIEQTEGMVAIDVNSGKFTGKRNLEETVFKVNSEAAEEIARQLRLRDIGGIIIIDFIDMESSKHRSEVFNILQNALKTDKARTNIISFSELNVVEMTRQRIRKSLESVSYHECRYCNGKGKVKSCKTVAIIALRKLKAFLKIHRAKRQPIELLVHPDVAQRLVNEDSHSLDSLKSSFRRQISVVADDSLHVEDVKVELARY